MTQNFKYKDFMCNIKISDGTDLSDHFASSVMVKNQPMPLKWSFEVRL